MEGVWIRLIIWYRNEESGEVIWLDSDKEFEGYENLGYDYTEIDEWGKRTHYEGKTRTKYVNFEPVKSYKKNMVGKIGNFVTDELVSPVLEGAQIVGRHIPMATAKAISLQIDDVRSGGDGTNIRAKMKMPTYTIQNGKILKTDLNQYSPGEISSSGFSALTAPINVVKTGFSGFFGKATDFILNNGVFGFFSGKAVEKINKKN